MEKERDDGTAGFVIMLVIAALIATLLLGSCSSLERTTEPMVATQYVTVSDNHYVHDSIYLHTSDTVLVRGDTVEVVKWRDVLQYKEVWRDRTDTVLLADTIRLTETVEAEMSWWDRTRIKTWGWIATLLLALVIAVVVAAKIKD